MIILKFSYNWNKKLECKTFTTLRLSKAYKVNDFIKVTCKGIEDFDAQIIGKKSFLLKDINDYVAYIDTGYDAEECKNILRKMYKNKNVDWDKQKIYFYLIKKV